MPCVSGSNQINYRHYGLTTDDVQNALLTQSVNCRQEKFPEMLQNLSVRTFGRLNTEEDLIMLLSKI